MSLQTSLTMPTILFIGKEMPKVTIYLRVGKSPMGKIYVTSTSKPNYEPIKNKNNNRKSHFYPTVFFCFRTGYTRQII